MRRITLLLTVALVMALMMAVAGGPASAISENASDRACVGAFLSTAATTVQPLGQLVQQEAKEFHPLGQTVVSPVATTCEDPEG
jgi:hypothetical protein